MTEKTAKFANRMGEEFSFLHSLWTGCITNDMKVETAMEDRMFAVLMATSVHNCFKCAMVAWPPLKHEVKSIGIRR